MENTPPMREETDGKVFNSARFGIFVFVLIMTKTLFPNSTLTWRVSNYVFRQVKSINTKNESALFIMIIVYDCTNFMEYFWSTQLTVKD